MPVPDALAPPDTEPSAIPPALGTGPFGLTPREPEVLRRLCQRRTDPEIAAALFVGYRTVTTHVGRVLAKLGVDSRRAAAAAPTRSRRRSFPAPDASAANRQQGGPL